MSLNPAVPRSPIDRSLVRVCAWSGPAFAGVLVIAAATVMRFIPPPREHWSAAEVAAFYGQHSLGIRIGATAIMLVAPAYFLWSLAIDRVLSYAEPEDSIVRRVQRFGGFSTAYVAAGTGLFWLVAAFYGTRGGADPQVITALNDLGFIIFNLWFTFTLVQLLVMSAVWLTGRQNLIPRWLGYFGLFDAASFFAVTFIPFFKTGPIAWHGILTFYTVLGIFFLWMLVTSWKVVEALKIIEQREADQSVLVG